MTKDTETSKDTLQFKNIPFIKTKFVAMKK